MSTFGNMYTGTAVKPGQYEKTSAGSASFVVPEGVTSICAVVVGAPVPEGTSAVDTTIRRSTTTLLSSSSAIGGGIGGGNGGPGGAATTFVTYVEKHTPGGWGTYPVYNDIAGGGGGAGGYSGNGGYGGGARVNSEGGSEGGAGAGGAGAGGGGEAINQYGDGSTGGIHTAYSGGGVGLRGIGSNGAPVASGYGSGGPGSFIVAGQPLVGGGKPGYGGIRDDEGNGTYGTGGGRGGNLRYLNDIPVTPGETLTLYCASGGGLRVMWGGGRSFPNNAGDL